MAAFMGHFDFLNLLIQNGADISKENKVFLITIWILFSME
jgi:hypothetical protein